jgi:hypothetical protein
MRWGEGVEKAGRRRCVDGCHGVVRPSVLVSTGQRMRVTSGHEGASSGRLTLVSLGRVQVRRSEAVNDERRRRARGHAARK